MKKANIVLSILILLLATASAVFSYLLFARRIQMVEGWKKLATAINQNAREMDKGSGTSVGDALTAEALSHENYAELDQKLSKLTTQSRDLVKQRDILADSLKEIAGIVEMENSPDSKALRGVATYSAAKDAVINGARDMVDHRNKIAGAIVDTGKNLKIKLDDRRLRAADEEMLRQFRDRMAQFDKLRGDFDRTLAEIYRQCDGQGPNFSGDDFAGRLDKTTQAFNAMKKKLDEANQTIAALDRKIQQQLARIGEQDGQLARTRDELGKIRDQFEGLREALGLTAPIPRKWDDGSPEARRQAIGRVVDVKPKLGYIMINLGSESTVPQQHGSQLDDINIAMATGLEMTVSRGELEVPTAEYITRVKITKVGKECSIAEPFGNQNGTVEIGDKVWFDVK